MSILNFNTFSLVAPLMLVACTTTGGKYHKNIDIESLLKSSEASEVNKELLSASSVKKAENDLENGRVKSSLKYANLALQFDPNSLTAKTIAGKAEIANQNYQIGTQYFSEIIKVNPSSENFQFLGIGLYFTGRTDEAVFALTSAHTGDATLWRASVLLARIKNKQGEIENADALFSTALSYAKMPEVVYEHMGQAYAEREAWPQAVIAFKMAQSLSDNQVGRHDEYWFSLAKTNQLNTVLTQAKSNDIARLYRTLGKESLDTGDAIDAIENFKKAQSHFSRYDKMTDQLMKRALNLLS